MKTQAVVLVSLAIAVLASACIPVPVVTPPMKVKFGGGVAFGNLTDEPDAVRDPASVPVFNLSVGVHPLQYWEEAEGFDLGVGFVMDALTEPDLKETPLIGSYLEGGYVLWSKGKREEGQGRLIALVRGDLLKESGDDGDTGIGIAVGLSLEYLSWQEDAVATTQVTSDGRDTDVSSFLGFAYGESSIGLEVSANLRQVGGQRYNALMMHLIFRTPTLAGILLVPLYD